MKDSETTKPRTKKAEETRTRILEAALTLFREVGYEKATMRVIAERAGVSVGNAYYYFKSKEELTQAFYFRTHEEHLAVALPGLEGKKTLEQRLRVGMETKLETIEPYHSFSSVLFKAAVDPKSPLNPFSAESAPVREEAIELFDAIVEGSSQKIPKDLRGDLPELLWMWHMSIILYWIHDDSEERWRTRRLMERTSSIVLTLIKISGLPLIGPLRRSALKLIKELKSDVRPATD